MIKNMIQLCGELANELELMPEDGMDLVGFDTGFKSLNNLTLGITPGFHILMGRPSMGKTTLSLNLAENIADKVPTLYFSIEMTSIAIVRKIISSRTKIGYRDLRLGKISESEWDTLTRSLADLQRSKLHLVEETGMTTERIKQYCMEFREKYPKFFVVVDYLQLVKPGGKAHSREREVGEISNSLKFLAKELQIPILVLSQMNRDCENRTDPRPKMSDLRDSGSLEQDADIIMGIYRPEMMRHEADYEGQTFLDILKNREGETGYIELRFNGAQQRFNEKYY